MFTDSLLSSSLLLLGSGSCLYLVSKDLTNNFSTIRSGVVAASVGVLAINIRSVFNLVSPFIFRSLYSIEPIKICNEAQDLVEIRIVPLHEKLCRVLSVSGLTLAICDFHESRLYGCCITITILSIEVLHAFGNHYPQHQDNKFFHSLWMLGPAILGWAKGNAFCCWALLPYSISFIFLMPEKDKAWSIRRIINNYMMLIYVFLMLEAAREAQVISA